MGGVAAALVIGAIAGKGAAMSMTPTIPTPPEPPEAEDPRTKPKTQAAGEQRRKRQKQAGGNAQTQATGPLGLPASELAGAGVQKTLLGA
jgi:hypothetical protein